MIQKFLKNRFYVRTRRSCGMAGCVNGRELVVAYRLLRNSTKIAAQFLGLEQCSQTDSGKRRQAQAAALLSTQPAMPQDLLPTINPGFFGKAEGPR
ncbi:MAG: hypothetical protein IPG06_19180 [Haliea sp.]|nr:hypothetical protein [Haliea sp.]